MSYVVYMDLCLPYKQDAWVIQVGTFKEVVSFRYLGTIINGRTKGLGDRGKNTSNTYSYNEKKNRKISNKTKQKYLKVAIRPNRMRKMCLTRTEEEKLKRLKGK